MTAATPTAAIIVASYAGRVRFARAETAAVHRPRLLRGLLDTATHVAEIPCGAGHFLATYACAGAAVTLVDASESMLGAAVEDAADVGLAGGPTHPIVAYWQDLPRLDDVDLVVVPNAALNQLACQTPVTDLLTQLRAVVRAGTDVLAQVACTHPGGAMDTATFYDPARQHGVWFADRWFDPDLAGGAVLRRRRQHRDGNRLRVEFDYRDPADISLHTTAVELALFSAVRLTGAFTAAGFTHVRFLPGHGCLSEALATARGGQR
jgi:SAM-dependent methyltransferase